MDVVDFLILLFIVLVIGSIFSYGFKSRGPWGSIWAFMLVLLLAGWAGMLWITPTGPVYWGFAWIPIVFFILLIAALLGAATPSARHNDIAHQPTRPRRERVDDEEEEVVALGLFFWIFIIFLIIAILVGLFV
ncbi:hypothetical protein JKA74_00895 [Marivirga sp. S37H4]|uniref:Uncharacterized protein n=1 Tax=Marivirga aurantiaca TaxID=2802615 RepID=A0A935C523_9BACT|nr:hypothetical protein [Marivirga aurantiaca]MBK6263575.1 hypothetical protein [Marivirga aurantiaca]